MAYVIPVAALILDHQAAAAALNDPAKYPPDYFDNPRHDRWEGLEELQKVTGAPVESFSDENQEIYYIGLQIESDWRIDINAALVAKSAALKKQYPHPLVQAATLAVVSQFN